ncbi:MULTISPECIES: hypothetical protein [unclassified Lentimonas]|uniref:hypothetical protein n=1 Tax=unclassified Lentimonas TaxID=2630993 RepID=UPI00138976F4|nr:MULTISPECIES: hypothetical protein [unclassified Lentimonas]
MMISRGDMERRIDLSAAMTASLSFDWKAASLEGSDVFYVEIDDDGGGSNLQTIDAADINSAWARETIDLSGFAFGADMKIRFNGEMSGNGDFVYLDNIVIE